MTDTIDLLLDAVQEAYEEETPNEALRPAFIEHVEQARKDERAKVLSEVEGWLVKSDEYPDPDGIIGYHNEKIAELRTKLNQLKGK